MGELRQLDFTTGPWMVSFLTFAVRLWPVQ